MSEAVDLVEIWRGDLLESSHKGHAVIMGPEGIRAAWGNPEAVIYPRSSCKMIQALPLLESGAADQAGLTAKELALSCASHSGGAIHTEAVGQWISNLGLSVDDFRCGCHEPWDITERNRLIRADEKPCPLHNNCSGKHAGFLTWNKFNGGDAEYHLIDHPLQKASLQAFEEVTGETSPGYGIDGCSAPNFQTSVTGLARAMAAFASAHTRTGLRAQSQQRLVEAMTLHPEMVANPGRACTELMQACGGRAAIKTGAEAVYVAIIPEIETGIALKIVDGGTRAAEATITALLVRLGILDAAHPTAQRYMATPMKNWNELHYGDLRMAAALRA